jgi:segregation and condensation protein A
VVFEAPPYGRYDACIVEPPSDFSVELPLFSGPFRLLADLILEQRMDVCDVPVARVTERFIEYGAERLDGWSLEEATWFLAVCAALLELKVGRLLPRPTVDTEEDLLGGASPDLVYARSLELAAFRQVATALAELAGAATLSVPRSVAPPRELAHLYPDPLEKVTADLLAGVAGALLAPIPDLDLSHVTPITATLAEGLRAVQERMEVKGNARFRDLLEDCEERIEVVVRFLALLELYREGKVELLQADLFGDIEVRWQGQFREIAEAPGELGATSGSRPASPKGDIQ